MSLIKNACWYACNPSTGRLMQEDCELQTSLGYLVRSCQKQKTKNKKPSFKKKKRP
jgi:hypothetical protein